MTDGDVLAMLAIRPHLAMDGQLQGILAAVGTLIPDFSLPASLLLERLPERLEKSLIMTVGGQQAR